MQDRRNYVVFECSYCEQMFDSKEKLYDHVEDHSDAERGKEEPPRKKQAKK